MYIFFPQEHPQLPHISGQHLQWAIERFATMQSRNPLAKSADTVLRAVLERVNRMASSRLLGEDSEATACSLAESSSTSDSEPETDSGKFSTQTMESHVISLDDSGDHFEAVLGPDTVWHFSNLFPQ